MYFDESRNKYFTHKYLKIFSIETLPRSIGLVACICDLLRGNNLPTPREAYGYFQLKLKKKRKRKASCIRLPHIKGYIEKGLRRCIMYFTKHYSLTIHE